jgi:tetratricopeptide (TPR) repeat protein
MARHGLFIIAALKNLQRVGAILVIIAATFLVYWPAQRNGFVWDDSALVQRDPLIRSWELIPESFRHFLFLDATASNFYRPIQRLTFTGDYALYDRSARGWHLTSIYVHLAAAIALFFLVEKLLAPTVGRGWAFAVALLWVIHPLHTSAVTYISGRADPLQAFFGFCALTFALHSLDGGKYARVATLGAALCFLGALLSKEAGFVALLIWFVVLAWRRVPRAVWLKWIGLSAAVVAVYAGLRFTAESRSPPREDATTLAVRPILAARAVAEYAGLILAPVNLRMERDVSSAVGPLQERPANAQRREWQTLLGLGLITGLVFWWRWTRRRVPIAALSLLAALVAYVPVSNLFSLNATVAEHWLYVPLAFLLLAGALSLREVIAHSRALTAALGIVTAAWAVCLGVRTWQRQPDWKDQRTFLTRTIAAGGDSARMRVNLGQLESAEGRDDLALEEFRKALKLDPNQSFAKLGAAAVLMRLQKFEAAAPLLEQAAKHPACAVEAHHLQARLRAVITGVDDPEALRKILSEAPYYWPSWRRYFAASDRPNIRSGAIRELRAFLNEQPFRAESWAMLGDLLAKEYSYPEAIAAFSQATKFDVHDEESRKRIEILKRMPDPWPAPVE